MDHLARLGTNRGQWSPLYTRAQGHACFPSRTHGSDENERLYGTAAFVALCARGAEEEPYTGAPDALGGGASHAELD